MISLLHPSRERPTMAFYTFNRWMSKASGEIEIQHILSLDTTDILMAEYLGLFESSTILLNDNKNVVNATNQAAYYSTGDILVYLSDDFDCPKDWDKSISKIFESITEPKLLKVDDCLQPFHAPVLTIPIMNRLLYDKLGYFWNPSYASMFVDQDLFEVVKKNGWITYAPGLQFPHEHWINKKAEIDETYKRSELNWKQGEEMFNKRKLEGFPV